VNNKAVYTSLSETEKRIPLFSSPTWLNAIAPNNWDVAIAQKGDTILGVMPYFIKKKMGFTIMTMPPLTPYLGPILFYPEGQKSGTKLSFEKEIMEILIAQLPKTDKFIQYFHPDITNGLPFQWKDFEQCVRYTYIVPKGKLKEECWGDLHGNIRRAIKKAEQSFHVSETENASQIHRLKEKDYADKNLQLNYNEGYFTSLCKALITNETGKILTAKDEDGKTIAGILLGIDSGSIYYVSGAIDPEYRSSSALSLLMWKGIELAVERKLSFNFEGSMIESIERYFRSFGAEQVPYFEVKKIDSKLLQLI
jgi:hypothetical protein